MTVEDQLFKKQNVRGTCQVICFSPTHNKTVAEFTAQEILFVIETWKNAYTQLSKLEFVNHVLIFENKGASMGCSNPHPHGQVWATEMVPEEPQKEINSMVKYKEINGTCLLCDYVKLELEKRDRIVCENASFVVLVPYWAIWPFETIILPKTHIDKLTRLSESESIDLADVIRLFYIIQAYYMPLRQSLYLFISILDGDPWLSD